MTPYQLCVHCVQDRKLNIYTRIVCICLHFRTKIQTTPDSLLALKIKFQEYFHSANIPEAISKLHIFHSTLVHANFEIPKRSRYKIS